MKSFRTILTLLVMALFSVHSVRAAFGDGNPAMFPALRKGCQAKSANALYAIEKYCKNKDLVSF